MVQPFFLLEEYYSFIFSRFVKVLEKYKKRLNMPKTLVGMSLSRYIHISIPPFA
jgi:hypothetical protein